MKATESRKGFYQGAMRQGTILGIAWSIMFLLLFMGTSNILLLLTSMLLYMGSPAIAALLAIKYRKSECNNAMTYMQAWGFVFYMYIFASIFNAFVMFLYFKFIDSISTPGLPEVMKQQLQSTTEMISNISPTDFTWTILNGNISNACFLPFLIAIFVRKTAK